MVLPHVEVSRIVSNIDSHLPTGKIRGVSFDVKFNKKTIFISCGEGPNITCFIVPFIVYTVT